MDLEVLLATMYEIAGAKILDSFYNLLGVDLSIFFAADWTNPFCSIFFLDVKGKVEALQGVWKWPKMYHLNFYPYIVL